MERFLKGLLLKRNDWCLQNGLKDQSKLSEPFKELDIFLTQVLSFAHFQVYFVSFPFLSVNIDDVNVKILYQIAAGVSLDILPGPNDPANFSLPQQVFLLNMSFKFVLLLLLEASDCS